MPSADSVSPPDAVIPWRMRRDVIVRAAAGGGDAGWTLKDPLSLAYFRLRDAEYAVVRLLDDRMTYGEVLDALRRTFPAEAWSLENLKAFIGSLVQSGLLTSLRMGQGRALAKQRELARQRGRWGLLTKVLSLRWQGIDPEPLLRRVEPRTRWLFRPLTLAACPLTARSAGVFIAATASRQRAPSGINADAGFHNPRLTAPGSAAGSATSPIGNPRRSRPGISVR